MAGLVVFVKLTLNRFITRIFDDFEFSILLKIDKTISLTGSDVVLCLAYLPPEQSPFYRNKEYKGINLIESILSEYDIDVNSNFMLIGDMNARTANRHDFITVNRNVAEYEAVVDILDDSHLTLRRSRDTSVNSFGLNLLEYCKANAIRIVNGRIHDDINGEYTYISHNGCSVIDYLICSDDVFQLIANFKIENRTESCHMPIRFEYEIKGLQGNRDVLDENRNVKIKYIFDERRTQQFKHEISSNFSQIFITEFCTRIEDNNTSISTLVGILTDKLRLSGNVCLVERKSYTVIQPMWFDAKCRTLKYLKNKALRVFRRNRIKSNLDAYLDSKREFSNYCDQQKHKYNEKQLEELIDKNTNAKSFWSKLKRMTVETRREENITIDQWKTHFEQLFNSDLDVDNIIPELEDIQYDDDITDELFNGEITADEVARAVRSMKRGKSGGNDELIPEFFLESIESLLCIIIKLFNRIFSDGIYPEQWCESIVVPIYKKGNRNVPDNYRGISLLNVLGKIYTNVICRRLTFYVNIYEKIGEPQAGLEKGTEQ
ncbi:uncharacterized protein LOC128546354 [Mercenaria mercenaria]|uniref:uncharacterized protein LOC128546354 n=1 Tax=Mercenaria mercenaria TaxID=6596 RepID=UPI00234EC665|nr:uncharacterized protein LOC128546354 [Mercenaria mercenaria]